VHASVDPRVLEETWAEHFGEPHLVQHGPWRRVRFPPPFGYIPIAVGVGAEDNHPEWEAATVVSFLSLDSNGLTNSSLEVVAELKSTISRAMATPNKAVGKKQRQSISLYLDTFPSLVCDGS